MATYPLPLPSFAIAALHAVALSRGVRLNRMLVETLRAAFPDAFNEPIKPSKALAARRKAVADFVATYAAEIRRPKTKVRRALVKLALNTDHAKLYNQTLDLDAAVAALAHRGKLTNDACVLSLLERGIELLPGLPHPLEA